MHFRRFLLLALLAFPMLVMVSSAMAASRSQAQTKARQAANHYTNGHYGIGAASWRSWSASCHRFGTGWKCSVRLSGGQCSGTLKLSRGLNPYGHAIGCMER